MKDNYYKKKKKYEILNKLNKMKQEAFIYHNFTKDMIEEYNKILEEVSTITPEQWREIEELSTRNSDK